jgi:bifunctional non-homologous end joining protein LigD
MKSLVTPQPLSVKPMLCTLIKEPFNDERYIYEVKWDGYRIIARKNNNVIKLDSRGGQDYTKKYPAVVKALKAFEHDLIFDGEVVYINKEGKPDFDALQTVNGQKAPITYYVFDILWLDGKDLMKLPLLERKEILGELVGDNTVIKYSAHFDDGLILYDHAKSFGLEGIVAKQKDSSYIPNDRSKKWYKIPTDIKQEFVIGGWIESEADRHFRTLLFGAYEGKDLKWIGHAGGGYKDREMPEILKKLKSMEISTSPFVNEVDYEGVVHWVKPQLVANIKYATLTKSGKIRKPAIFQGFREDKNPMDVVREVAKEHIKHVREVQTAADSNWPTVEAEPIKSRGEVIIEGHKVALRNVEKEIWKGVTKADLIQYYSSVAGYILPHLRDRALSLHIKHKGPNAPGLYIKDMEGRQPEHAELYTTPRKHKKAGKRDVIDYLVCNNTATLLYLVDLGCIDINPWTSTTDNALHPTFIVIDLDPSDEDFTKAIETAKAAKQFFDELKLKAFLKTSGKTGLHLFLPCSAFTFPQARKIAEAICNGIHSLVADITTTTLTVADRGNKLYVDPNQNDYADTVAAAYSVRPYKHPQVSAPINWTELKRSLVPDDFTIANIHARLEKKGDLFIGSLDKKNSIQNDKVLKTFL